MPLLNLPNELLLFIAGYLPQKTLYSFLRANRFFASLLAPLLHEFAFRDKEGVPALLWAARGGFEPLIRILLIQGQKPNPQATHSVVARDVTRSNKLDINVRDSRGQTALHIAAYEGHTAIVRLLLELGNGIDISAISNMGNTALHLATSYTSRDRKLYDEIVELLLSNHIDVNSKSRSEEDTALHQAAAYGYPGTVKQLLAHENNANLDAVNGVGRTPLHRATIGGQIEIIKILLENGASINERDHCGMTPLHHAVLYQHDIATIQLLLEKGADINIGDNYERTALHLAARKRYVGKAKLLLENGADIDARTMDGVTPLASAVASRSVEIAQMLVDRGAGSKNALLRAILERLGEGNNRLMGPTG